MLDQETVREINTKLAAAFKDLTEVFRAAAKRMHEQQQVAELFALYRSGDDDRIQRLHAAIDRYPTEFLADLIRFSRFLADNAQRVWDKRAS